MAGRRSISASQLKTMLERRVSGTEIVGAFTVEDGIHTAVSDLRRYRVHSCQSPTPNVTDPWRSACFMAYSPSSHQDPQGWMGRVCFVDWAKGSDTARSKRLKVQARTSSPDRQHCLGWVAGYRARQDLSQDEGQIRPEFVLTTLQS